MLKLDFRRDVHGTCTDGEAAPYGRGPPYSRGGGGGADVLIIGGGTAGCYAAMQLGRKPELAVLVAEKANIERSGCLAAGVNALNAYISGGHTPADYVE